MIGVPRSRTRAADLESRRLRAINLVGRGASQAAVARRLGVTREAVRQWVGAWRAGGPAALAPRTHARGRRVDLARVGEALARATRSARRMLTTRQVIALIDRVFGVAYSASSVRAILGRLGFSYSRKGGWRLAPARHSPAKGRAPHTPRERRAHLRAS